MARNFRRNSPLLKPTPVGLSAVAVVGRLQCAAGALASHLGGGRDRVGIFPKNVVFSM